MGSVQPPNLLGYGEFPQINDSGQAVWTDAAGGAYLYREGTPIQIADNYYPSPTNSPLISNSPALINNRGQVVWQGWDGQDSEVFLYDRGIVTQITHNTCNDLNPQINSQGWVIWYAGLDSSSEIFLYQGGGNPIQLTGDLANDTNPVINDQGQIAWNRQNPYLGTAESKVAA